MVVRHGSTSRPATMIDSNALVEDLFADIERRKFQQIVFLVGSVVSGIGPSACATVSTIRDDLVLRSLKRRFEVMSASADQGAAAALLEMMVTDGHALRRAVTELPFEQFMSCLDRIAPEHTYQVIQLACRDGGSFTPNFNHRAIAQIALQLASSGLTPVVTVLTTNYDLGLESAWSESSGVTLVQIKDASFPAYDVMQGNRRQLRYGKLHGCLRERDSLVYTFEKLADGVLRPERMAGALASWFTPAAKTLVLSFGYGYNDPDLRPVLGKIFVRPHTRVFRTERPLESKRPDKPSEPTRLLGTDVLRQEALDGFDLTTIPSNLWVGDDANLVVRLAGRFTKVVPAVEENGAVKFPTAPVAVQTEKILGELKPRQVVHFLTALVDGCYRADACDQLAKIMATADEATCEPEFLELYLKQFGHAHDLPGEAKAARVVRLRWRSPDVRVLCYAAESFALSLDGHRPAWARVFTPMQRLALARMALGRCTERTRNMFVHYNSHFWLKLFQYAEAKMPAPVLPIHRWLARWEGRRLAAALASARIFGESQNDARLAAEAGNMEAQAWILAGDPPKAYATAVRAQTLCSAQNAFHVTLQCDRTVAWTLLASGQTEDIFRAFRTLARGLLRAIHAADPSLRPKLGVNFLRVALYLANGRLALGDVRSVAGGTTTVINALHALHTVKRVDEIPWETFKVVAADVLASCSAPEYVAFILQRYGNVGLYPVLLFEE